MKTGPRYKLARRLGSPIFEKTQTQGYARSLARKEKAGTLPTRPKSEYGQALLEKQKVRFSYGISEKQFAKYVKSALTAVNPAETLFRNLELRLDNALYRAGLAKTRLQARQMASHGHTLVNGRRVTIPSIMLKEGDVIGVREGSSGSPMFLEAEERMKTNTAPAWLTLTPEKREAKVVGKPLYVQTEAAFNLGTVLEFYSR